MKAPATVVLDEDDQITEVWFGDGTAYPVKLGSFKRDHERMSWIDDETGASIIIVWTGSIQVHRA